jgi:hypothetical protein
LPQRGADLLEIDHGGLDAGSKRNDVARRRGRHGVAGFAQAMVGFRDQALGPEKSLAAALGGKPSKRLRGMPLRFHRDWLGCRPSATTTITGFISPKHARQAYKVFFADGSKAYLPGATARRNAKPQLSSLKGQPGAVHAPSACHISSQRNRSRCTIRASSIPTPVRRRRAGVSFRRHLLGVKKRQRDGSVKQRSKRS